MSETIIVYVTRSGRSRILAQELGAIVGAPVHELRDKVDRRGPIGFIKTLYHAATGRSTPIDETTTDLGAIRNVVLVQPIWTMSVCPPLRTWLSRHQSELAGKKLALLASNFGTPAGALRARFEREFGPLSAFDAIPERLGPAERGTRLGDFAVALNGRSM